MLERFRATPSGEESAELFECGCTAVPCAVKKLRSPAAAGERFGFIPKFYIIGGSE